MTYPWVSSLEPPVSSPVSSPSRPRRTLSLSAASLVIRTIVSTWRTSIVYGPWAAYNIPPVAAVSFVTSRRRRLVVGLVPGTAGLVPSFVAVSSPPNSVATAVASLVATISSKHSTCAISVDTLGNVAKQDGGRMANVYSNCTERQVTSKNHSA